MQYSYKHPDTEEIIEVTQGMNDVHEYIDEYGMKWERVWTVPYAAIDTQIDPFSSKQFVEKTKGKGTIGDLFDRSAELSHIRAEKRGGVDPTKEKYEKDYAKARGGRKPLKKMKDVVVNI